mmetsp:Transcript_18832/g.56186  ORF Transcript_18832/g.56186 Transcript_18832/m.56186 type:complete len:301 (+) Transcript_18832:560-1462(+)
MPLEHARGQHVQELGHDDQRRLRLALGSTAFVHISQQQRRGDRLRVGQLQLRAGRRLHRVLINVGHDDGRLEGRERQPPELRDVRREADDVVEGHVPQPDVVLPEDRLALQRQPLLLQRALPLVQPPLGQDVHDRAGRDVPVELPEQRHDPVVPPDQRHVDARHVHGDRLQPAAAREPRRPPQHVLGRHPRRRALANVGERRLVLGDAHDEVVVHDEAVVGRRQHDALLLLARQAQDHGRPKMPPDVLEGPPAAARPVGADHFYVLALERQQVQRHGAHGRDERASHQRGVDDRRREDGY